MRKAAPLSQRMERKRLELLSISEQLRAVTKLRGLESISVCGPVRLGLDGQPGRAEALELTAHSTHEKDHSERGKGHVGYKRSH